MAEEEKKNLECSSTLNKEMSRTFELSRTEKTPNDTTLFEQQ